MPSRVAHLIYVGLVPIPRAWGVVLSPFKQQERSDTVVVGSKKVRRG